MAHVININLTNSDNTDNMIKDYYFGIVGGLAIII